MYFEKVIGFEWKRFTYQHGQGRMGGDALSNHNITYYIIKLYNEHS